ncbi:MAG TPA: cytochrome c [Candidatus Acidoferrum sp.]|nr:cytochrome c [Candidatus Acidoferrum sp.]
MFTKRIFGIAVAASLLIAASALVFANQGAMGAQEKEQTPIKKVPLPYSKPDSGAQMYKDYCAVCHGIDGKGDGPAVEYLKTPPPSLRTLAKRNDGKYPGTKVTAVLQFGSGNHAHGTLDMPLWGPAFRATGGHGIATLRINNLTKHIETLQEK